MQNKKTRLIILITCLVLFVIALVAMASSGVKLKKKVSVGFIINGGIDETGWNGLHYQGLKSACDELELNLIVKENIAEYSGQCATAIDELVKEGASVIILTSYSYASEAETLMDKYKDVIFYCNSPGFEKPNSIGYFVRYYQARYLSGILAGLQTETNEIGYVAGFDITEVNRGINAFTLGVKRVNPDAKVYVTFSGNWDDKDSEIEAANKLINSTNLDILTYHQNQPNLAAYAEEKGLYSIGYHQPLENPSDKYLTAVICQWHTTYAELLKAFLKGNYPDNDKWWLGLETDSVTLSPYSPIVPEETRNEIEKARNEILNGKDVFSGEIYDNQGNLRCTENENISDDILFHDMEWYVDGVEIIE